MTITTETQDARRRILKVPALNIAYICGIVTTAPRASPAGESTFDLAVRSYRPGKKTLTTLVEVHCAGALADVARTHLRAGAVVLVSGSLRRSERDAAVHVTASLIQFLSDNEP